MSHKEIGRLSLVTRYLATALVIASPGAFFTGKAILMHMYRLRKLTVGIEVFEVPGMQGMPIDAYIRWMLVFSVPFFVGALFAIYRLILLLKCRSRCATSGQLAESETS